MKKEENSPLHVYFLRFLIPTLLLLIVSACGPTPTPAGGDGAPEPSPEPTPTGEGDGIDATEPMEEVEGIELSCEGSFDTEDFVKPPIDISELPEPPHEQLLNENRIIGFAFPGSRLALIASPATADCRLTNPDLGQAVGIVYTLAEVENPILYVISIVPESEVVFLLDAGLNVVAELNSSQEQVQVQVTDLRQLTEGAPPIDVAIIAGGLCFQLDSNGELFRYCIQAPQLSVRYLFPDNYGDLVASRIEEAQDRLISLAEELPPDVIDPLLEGSRANAEVAISEVESPAYIDECSPVDCPADIIVAPFTDKPMPNASVNLGVLVVDREIIAPDEAGTQILPVGDYIVHADTDSDGNLLQPVWATGVVGEDGSILEMEEIPSQLAFAFDPETRDVGLVAIAGCRLFSICLIFERC